MIISHRHRYVFVHIPKTGGTSLTLALELRVGRDDIILSDTPKGTRRRARVKGVRSRGRLWKHSTLTDIEGLVDPAIFDDYLLFTLVRNPWTARLAITAGCGFSGSITPRSGWRSNMTLRVFCASR